AVRPRRGTRIRGTARLTPCAGCEAYAVPGARLTPGPGAGHAPYPRAIVETRLGGNNKRGLTWRNQEFLRRYLTKKPRRRESRTRTAERAARRVRTSGRWRGFFHPWIFVSAAPALGTFA